MTQDCIAIIDGTGSYSDDSYDLTMMNSFCSQLNTVFAGSAHYQRGPSAEGALVETKGFIASQYLTERKGGGAKRLFLAGYSRGGSSALLAAEKLRKKNIQVDGIILFDPVAKYIGSGVKQMPSNVKSSIIFVRQLTPEFVKKYENKILTALDMSISTYAKALINPIGFARNPKPARGLLPEFIGNPLRPGWGEYFKHLTNSSSVDHRYYTLAASHGALGGVGWTAANGIEDEIVSEDTEGQEIVVKHTNNMLMHWKINKRIKVLSNKACFSSTRKNLDEVNAKSKVEDVHRSFRITPKGV